jgi:hypothetical protein
MSNPLMFDILPFDPTVIPNPEVRLPIDLDDLVQQLQENWPGGEVLVDKTEGDASIRLYVSIEDYGEWILGGFIERHSYFYVMGWPRRMAKDLIHWYRQYIPARITLYIVVSDVGNVTELKPDITLDDIEKLYPFPVADD